MDRASTFVDTVLLAQGGDSSAKTELVVALLPRARRVARRYASGFLKLSDSPKDDLVQELVLHFLRKLSKFSLDPHADAARTEDEFWSWVTSLMTHRCIDLYRKSKRYRAASSSSTGVIPSATRWVDHFRRSFTIAALKSVGAETAELIRMVYIEEQSIADAAEALGLNVNTAKARLARAKRRLQPALREVQE